jgi:hypothetical protein
MKRIIIVIIVCLSFLATTYAGRYYGEVVSTTPYGNGCLLFEVAIYYTPTNSLSDGYYIATTYIMQQANTGNGCLVFPPSPLDSLYHNATSPIESGIILGLAQSTVNNFPTVEIPAVVEGNFLRLNFLNYRTVYNLLIRGDEVVVESYQNYHGKQAIDISQLGSGTYKLFSIDKESRTILKAYFTK